MADLVQGVQTGAGREELAARLVEVAFYLRLHADLARACVLLERDPERARWLLAAAAAALEDAPVPLPRGVLSELRRLVAEATRLERQGDPGGAERPLSLAQGLCSLRLLGVLHHDLAGAASGCGEATRNDRPAGKAGVRAVPRLVR